MWVISLQNMWIALQLIPLVPSQGEIKLFWAIHCWPMPEKGAGGRKPVLGRSRHSGKEKHWLHSKSMQDADRAPGRKGWQPNCISWALPVSRRYYSYMQINKHWAEIKRQRKAEDGKKEKASAQAVDWSGKHHHKQKQILLLFRCTGALLFKTK